MNSKKSGMSLVAKQRAAGWIFLAPATIMIAVMSFYPMIRAFIISLQTGAGANMRFADPIFSIPAVHCQYISVSYYPGADHAGPCDPARTASE